MAKEIIVHITNGKGSSEIVIGNYNVTSTTLGYDDTTINPSTVEITEGIGTYSFKIGAVGTLTLHVSDDGSEAGIPIVGAKFVRCDADGQAYGDEIVTGEDGNAVFNYVPFLVEGTPPTIYYKQTDSDGQHTFDTELKNTTLVEETKLIEVQNPEAALINFTLTDLNYNDLPIADGQIIIAGT